MIFVRQNKPTAWTMVIASIVTATLGRDIRNRAYLHTVMAKLRAIGGDNE